jgi:choline dehydrogenase-like flavoprotein
MKGQHNSQFSFDYIVIGGGSSGCVAASRLIQDHGARVLLLESGPADNSQLIRMPAGTFKMLFGKTPYIKRYETSEQAHLNGRRVSIPQGNVIGGGSSVNVMAYTRGSKADYARWDRASGGFGWSWEDLLPYFRRQEGNQRLEDQAHSGDGPLKVSDPLYRVEAADRFVRTMQKLGLPFATDFNAGALRGVGYMQTTTSRARRCSAANAFLDPIRTNPALSLVTEAMATELLFDGRRAKGVRYLYGGQVKEAFASREIVLTAGAYATPKLLMLSGIGPAEHLTHHGIKILADLPGVGRNLQDHNIAVLSFTTNGQFGYFGEDSGVRAIRNAFQYFVFGSGPIASNGAETMAFINLDDPLGPPHLQIYCIGVMWPTQEAPPTGAGLTLMANLIAPKSRGSVRLRSSDPADDPIVDPNWLSDPGDAEILIRALRYLRKVAATHPISSIIDREVAPGPVAQSDDELLAFIKRTTESNYHPVGTCRMGGNDDPYAVLTPDLRVRGVDGLRVLDASMMPEIISSNTNATVMAVADRGVDLMMGKNTARVNVE